MNSVSRDDIAAMIDHTILKADATADMVQKLCDEAREHRFASVCVNPVWVSLVSRELAGTGVKTCSVVGFPLGTAAPGIKAAETRLAVEQGAEEIDMVINVGALKLGDTETVEKDIRAVVEASGSACVKVIIETCYLTDEEKVTACELAKSAGADFVKTSTGFGTGGATEKDVALMRKPAGDTMKVKASGGVKTLKDLLAMAAAGADRIGTSSGVAILAEV